MKNQESVQELTSEDKQIIHFLRDERWLLRKYNLSLEDFIQILHERGWILTGKCLSAKECARAKFILRRRFPEQTAPRWKWCKWDPFNNTKEREEFLMSII